MAGITENEAYEAWFKARIVYNPKIYEVMNFILKKRKPKILINRNPTINYGSLLCVKIKSIKNEFSEDYTMSMPLNKAAIYKYIENFLNCWKLLHGQSAAKIYYINK